MSKGLNGRAMTDDTQPLYLAQSRRRVVSDERMSDLASWTGTERFDRRPLPTDRAGMVYDGERLQLHVPGHRGHPWHPGMAYRRIRTGEDSLCRALQLRDGATVLDCTLGMGHDALVMANAGATVFGLELNPAQLVYTAMGMYDYSPKLSRRIHVRCTDMNGWLPNVAANSVDHVYIDPMFPKSNYRKHNITWALLRRVHGGDGAPGPALITEALRIARVSVVLKLPPYALPPEYPGVPTAVLVGSKRVQYARWGLKHGAEKTDD